LRLGPIRRLLLPVGDEILPLRAFVFTGTDDPEFVLKIQQRMAEDGTRRYLHYIAHCEPVDDESDDGFNVFVALDCNSDRQARQLASEYFSSILAFGRLRGQLGLKNI
jgi:hypothetical protein